jgi:hypothetical protein
MHRDHVRHLGDERHEAEVAQGVIRKRFGDRRVGSKLGPEHREGITVGTRLGGRDAGGDAEAARAALDHDRLAQRFLHRRLDQARDQVHAAAGRTLQDQPDRLVGPAALRRGRRHGEEKRQYLRSDGRSNGKEAAMHHL